MVTLENYLEKQQEEEVNKRRMTFQLIQGGKEPPNLPPSSDWLSALDPTTMFYVQTKTDPMDFICPGFMFLKMEGKMALLVPIGTQQVIPVNPTRFCNKYMLFYNAGLAPQEEGVPNDGNRDQPVGSSPDSNVDGHAGS